MSVLTAVEVQARNRPDLVAFDGAHGTVCYGDLALAVDALASALREQVPAGSRIGLLSPKSPAAVAGMLAVLGAGCAYVPIDAAWPAPRRRFVVQDAACRLVLVAGQARDADGLGVPTLALPDLRGNASGRGEPPVPPDTQPAATDTEMADTEMAWHRAGRDEEAYVLYTSGSTGTPKGVVITHGNASAFVRWAARAYPLAVGDRVAVHAPLHFDLPVYDIYVGLAGGATLYLVPEPVALFPQAVLRFLVEHAITHLYAVPSALTALVSRTTLADVGLPTLRQLLYAGEEFRPTALAALLAAAPEATATNLYGPIETNVITSFPVPRDALGALDRVPLGRPVDGAVVALLDGGRGDGGGEDSGGSEGGDNGTASERRAIEGEILVAGDCVTPGYLGRPDLTAAAFLNVTTESGRHRFYRTGDFARRTADGLLHLLGRRDGLVKSRGFRVELGEVESVIGAHPDVADVAVVAVPDPEITHRIHAVVVPRAGVDADALPTKILRYCRADQPAYLVPGTVHVRAELPYTSTGKVSRTALVDLITPTGDSR
jgi:L-proline---[L-prolyl-carrier protein] ligase